MNGVLRLTDEGYRLEADPRHAEAVIRDLGLSGAKSSKLLGSKDEKRKHASVGEVNVLASVDGLAPISAPAVFGHKPGRS